MSVVPKPVGFELELPDRVLRVEDTKKPLWHGNYGSGLLTLYLAATISGKTVPDTDIVLTVYTESQDEDFVRVTYYVKGSSTEDIVQDIKDTVLEHYAELKAMRAIESASTISRTLH